MTSFEYLKTGLTGLTPEDCDRLENYVLTWDIRGRQWTAERVETQPPRLAEGDHPGGRSGADCPQCPASSCHRSPGTTSRKMPEIP
ncbi:MAG: hypothetical protein ACLUNZ_13085 [Evtepia sp.]